MTPVDMSQKLILDLFSEDSTKQKKHLSLSTFKTTNTPSTEFGDWVHIDRWHTPAIQGNIAGQNV